MCRGLGHRQAVHLGQPHRQPLRRRQRQQQLLKVTRHTALLAVGGLQRLVDIAQRLVQIVAVAAAAPWAGLTQGRGAVGVGRPGPACANDPCRTRLVTKR